MVVQMMSHETSIFDKKQAGIHSTHKGTYRESNRYKIKLMESILHRALTSVKAALLIRNIYCEAKQSIHQISYLMDN